MRSRMAKYSSYDPPYRIEEKSIGWEKSTEQQGEGDTNMHGSPNLGYAQGEIVCLFFHIIQQNEQMQPRAYLL